ncbi:gamma-interferon-inducible lysosomal thiol reductase [Aethina tumida]|uniref:gamma-interferon-inducible lysosomal thiol reductase n=1 Tax=Aethina tumida TaxID=116153 RepID=UPI00214855DB|nr:gamma-interferon-inducible lysosomal thiol reductase [Aethina tumida]
MKLIAAIFVSLAVFSAAQGEQLKIRLFYESLCPYSINFTIHQLYPNYLLLGDDYLDLDFVPFGNAKIYNVSGGYLFECQHGAKECKGNKVQGCALDLYNISTAAAFINCDLGSGAPADDDNLLKCANEANIEWSEIQECLDSGRADELLAENGAKTQSVVPKITTVPAIEINGIYDNDEIEYAFLEVACRLLKNEPPACETRKNKL